MSQAHLDTPPVDPEHGGVAGQALLLPLLGLAGP